MAKVKKADETPLMRQYQQIKLKYPGALILFRVGDFYETFAEDAVKASEILDIVLTKRANGKASHVALAGFPYHSLDTYLPKLVRAGLRVAICDQLEEPQKGQKLVKRGVTELVTPGVTMNDKVLESRQSNFLCAVMMEGEAFGIAFLEISTGEFMVAEGGLDFIDKLLKSMAPSEVLYAKSKRNQFTKMFGDDFHSYTMDEWILSPDFGYDRLIQHFETANLKGFGIEELPLAIAAGGACLYYLEQTHHTMVDHINSVGRIEEDKYLWMDSFTIRNLELIRSNHPQGKSLLDIIDQTDTPMGGRLLKKWLLLPLKDLALIHARHQLVQALFDDENTSQKMAGIMRHVGDLERLITKVSTQRINPREVVQFKRSLKQMREVQQLCSSASTDIQEFGKQFSSVEKIIDRIEQEISDDAPMHTNKGGIFKSGLDATLDDLRKLAYQGKDYLLDLQKREIERTGITSLKIAFNNVFGYYIEVTNTHKDKVPDDWIRKQTLVNAERYITEELKEYEDKILTAEDKIVLIESNMYRDFVATLLDYVRTVQNDARLLAKLDCLNAFAKVAKSQNYCRPIVDNSLSLALSDCRHPVIEQQLPHGEAYIPNDILLNDGQQLIILTGPNMSGKSALLRQTALAVLLAQIGAFVPARHAQIGLVDKIYTRVGASDNISQGESTFMVEMTETASILNNLSARSLILLDEIGRGTSTFDGVSLAWAIAEYLSTHDTKPKTIFATHYHELNELENASTGVVNYHVTTKEVGKRVLFLRKIEKGGSEHSFGIHVARMAGVPAAVVKRADQILAELEKDKVNLSGRSKLKHLPQTEYQLNLFSIDDPRLKEITEQLASIDTNTISPIEALLKLNELKKTLSE